jgi:hypothetical protein
MTRPRARAYENTPIGYVLNPDGLPRTSRINWSRYAVEFAALTVALTVYVTALGLLVWLVPLLISHFHLTHAPWPAIAVGAYITLLLAWPLTRPGVRRGGGRS